MRIRKTPAGYEVGGVSFAGSRGIRAVEIRVDGGPWVGAILEPALSTFTWTRWHGVIPVMHIPPKASMMEARAQTSDRARRRKWMVRSVVANPIFPSKLVERAKATAVSARVARMPP